MTTAQNNASTTANTHQGGLVPRLRFPEFEGEWNPSKLGDCLTYQQPTPYLVSDTNYDDVHNTPVLTAGKTFILGYTNEEHGIFSSGLPVIIFDDFTTASKFVNFPFKAKSSAMKILSHVEGMNIRFMYELMQTIPFEVGAHKRHWISKFAPMSVPTPTLPEQQKIADCLSSLDDLIAAEDQKLATLKVHKKGLMQELFPREGESVPQIRFPEFEGTGEWEQVTLQDIIEIASGQIDPTIHPYRDMLHIGGDNIESHTGKIHSVKTAKDSGVTSGKYLFEEGDILYSKIRPALNKAAIVNFTGVCSADIYPIRPLNQRTTQKYLAYVLLSDSFLSYAIKHSGRSKIPKINRETLLAYELVIPYKLEQKKIADCLSSLDDRISAQAERIEALRVHKKGLMQGLFPVMEG